MFSVWGSWACWIDIDRCVADVVVCSRFIVFFCFGLILIVYWFFDRDDFDVGCMYFTSEQSEEGLIGLLIVVEFIPPALVMYDGEGLHSFFIEDEAVIAIFVSQIFAGYDVDVGISQARWLIVKVHRVDVHPFAPCRAGHSIKK